MFENFLVVIDQIELNVLLEFWLRNLLDITELIETWLNDENRSVRPSYTIFWIVKAKHE